MPPAPSAASPSDRLSGKTLAEVGEFALIEGLARVSASTPAVSVGIGDDAAVFLVSGSAVTSTDMLIEHVHFRQDWSQPGEIGRKAVAVNVADLEAMGARPVAMVVALGAPGELPARWVEEFLTGLREEAARAGVTLVGGDTTRARDITIAVTVVGETDGLEPVRRSGARPGQVVAVVGRLGWAAAGLTALRRGFRSPRAAVNAQRVPEPPYGQGRVAAEAGASAMIDISDGLRADLGHVAAASGVRIDLDPGALTVDEALRVVGQATGIDPLQFVLSGGEDHALAATFDEGFVPEGWRVIGRVLAASADAPAGVVVDGELPQGSAGWDHFLA